MNDENQSVYWGAPDPEFIRVCSECGEWAASGGSLCEDCAEDALND